MKTHMIGYDLNRSGQNYAALFEAIKKIGAWWHCLDSTWLVKSNASDTDIRDHLKPYIDQSDELLVAELTGSAAWVGFDGNCSNWLKKNL